MKLVTVTLALAGIIAAPAIASAQGNSGNTPGQQMQEKGSVPGSPGASGYTPGHQMQENGSKPGTKGASGYAPGGSSTTGSSVNDHDRDGIARKKSK